MLSILGQPTRMCDGTTRREVLRAGAMSALGTGALGLPALLAAGEGGTSTPNGSAKAVILVNLLGGPSHLDMFDMKPDAPPEIRGEFQPIPTSLPGYSICEHLPLTAKTMHLSSVIRTHSHLYNTHSPYNLLSGYSGPVIVDNIAKPTDHPSMGAVMQYAGLHNKGVPPYVWMPSHPGHSQSKYRAGPYGGFLGKRYDPLFTSYTPRFESETFQSTRIDPPTPIANPEMRSLDVIPEITLDRLNRRKSLLEQLDDNISRIARSREADSVDFYQRQAMELISSNKTRRAFDLTQEPDHIRNRYGRNLFGSCMLTARRLVEAGVTFVGVTTESQYHGAVGAGQWDTHSNNFKLLKNFNLPVLDRNYSALIEDLEDSGLLESTLVVLMGEMGRTPKVKSNGGRDHWTQCGFIVLTGGGVKRGTLFGTSDKRGAWPKENPVSSADHVATIYQLAGINPRTEIRNSLGRPVSVALDGEPVWDVIA